MVVFVVSFDDNTCLFRQLSLALLASAWLGKLDPLSKQNLRHGLVVLKKCFVGHFVGFQLLAAVAENDSDTFLPDVVVDISDLKDLLILLRNQQEGSAEILV